MATCPLCPALREGSWNVFSLGGWETSPLWPSTLFDCRSALCGILKTLRRHTDLARCGLDFWYQGLAVHLGAEAIEDRVSGVASCHSQNVQYVET